jgi:hypothetical protein
MPSPIYQDMANLIVGVPIWRCPSMFKNVAMWEHRTFDNEIFRCGKFYYTNSIIITDFCKLSFANVGFAEIKRTAKKHEDWLHQNTNVEAIQLLDTKRTVRRLKRRKPFELVQ